MANHLFCSSFHSSKGKSYTHNVLNSFGFINPSRLPISKRSSPMALRVLSFAPARIKNTLTIKAGLFILDNGMGMTTALTLQNVVLSGAGRIQVQTGTPRNLTLVTGNFTDSGTSGTASSIIYLAVGNLNWTVNGNLTINHRFSISEGASAADIGTTNVQVMETLDSVAECLTE